MMPGNGLRRVFFLVVLVLVGLSARSAYASLVFSGVATGKGAGIGGSNIVLTIQQNPTEQGCVGWNGTVDVIGAAACQGGLTPPVVGGDEKTGNSQTQTRTVGSAGVLSGSSLVVVLNVSQPAGGPFTAENINLTIYSPTGTVLFNSGNLIGAGTPPGGGITIDSSFQGQGNLGFAFILTDAQAAAAAPFICTSALVPGCAGIANINNFNNRFGLTSLLTNTSGGNETFSIADTTNVAITGPEPLTLLTMAGGLALLGILRRFRSLPGKH